MRNDAGTAGIRRAVVRTWLALLLIGAYRLARCAMALLGVAHWLGAAWAIALVLLAALMRWTVLLQVGAAVALIRWGIGRCCWL